jgi:hypothetical protein
VVVVATALNNSECLRLERAQRKGYLLLREYESHSGLELEWRAWCERNRAPFVKVEVCHEGATLEYSLDRFPTATDLTETEIDELALFALHGRGAEAPQCWANYGRVGFISLADAVLIAQRVLEFCRAGIRHWQAGATIARSEPLPQKKTA